MKKIFIPVAFIGFWVSSCATVCSPGMENCSMTQSDPSYEAQTGVAGEEKAWRDYESEQSQKKKKTSPKAVQKELNSWWRADYL